MNTQSRVNSSVNATLVFILSLLSFLIDGRLLARNPLHAHSTLLMLCQCCLFAYTVVDSGVVLTLLRICTPKDRMENYFYLTHHLATIYLTLIVSVYDYLPFFAGIRCLSEFSTPFLNARWFALKAGYCGTLGFRLLQTMVFISFLACRLIPIVPFWAWIVHTKRPLPASGLALLDSVVGWVQSPSDYIRGNSSAQNINPKLLSSPIPAEAHYQPYMRPHFELMATCCLVLDVLNCIWAFRLLQLTTSCWLKGAKPEQRRHDRKKKKQC